MFVDEWLSVHQPISDPVQMTCPWSRSSQVSAPGLWAHQWHPRPPSPPIPWLPRPPLPLSTRPLIPWSLRPQTPRSLGPLTPSPGGPGGPSNPQGLLVPRSPRTPTRPSGHHLAPWARDKLSPALHPGEKPYLRDGGLRRIRHVALERTEPDGTGSWFSTARPLLLSIGPSR